MTYLMKNDKFALLAEPEFPLGTALRLHRLVAMRDINDNVKKGDIGGLVSGPMNLSSDGECWIYGNSVAYSGARVMENAALKGGAQVSGQVVMQGNSLVRGDLTMLGHFTLDNDDNVYSHDTVLINMLVNRMGQYVLRGQTMFVPEFQLSGGNSSSYTIPAESCSQRLANYLACRQAGDRVAFLRKGNQLEMLLPNSDGVVSIDSIKQQLTSMSIY